MNTRIYGLETEYAIFHDGPGSDVPNHKTLFNLIHRALTLRVRTLRALYHKGGDFLENGSLIHYESQPARWLHGVLEWATPECSTPRELLAYGRSQMRVLPELAAEAERALSSHGCPGRVVLAKNNEDAYGNTYGSHENYFVEDRQPWSLRLLMVPAYALMWALFIACNLFTFVPLIVALFSILLLLMVLRLTLAIPGLRSLAEPVLRPLLRRIEGWSNLSEDRFIRCYGSLSRWLLAPFIILFSALCLPFLLRRFRRELVPFLASRPLIAGAGHVHLDRDGLRFELSARARAIRSLARVFWDGPAKPMIDVKHYFLYEGQVFDRRKRLHLLCGDSNLCEVAEFLKFASTGLVLSVIEEGGLLPPIRLADPVAANHAVSADPTGRVQLALKGGGTITALEIQKIYLAAARKYLDRRGIVDSYTLREWERVIEAIEHEPATLYRDLDWAAKKQLMDEALLAAGGWDCFEGWGPALSALAAERGLAEIPAANAREALDALRTTLPPTRLAAIEELLRARGPSADWKGLAERWKIYLVLRKIDLKYHQLAPADGYFLQLERQGLVRGILTPEEVDRAQQHPPSRTRARIRGAFIKAVHGRGIEASAGWDRLRIDEPVEIGRRHYLRRRLAIDDPFDYRNEEAGRFMEEIKALRKIDEVA